MAKHAGNEDEIDSEKRNSEQALAESEHRLRRAQEIAHLGSWELDLVRNELTWSDEVYRIFGLQAQEFAATYEAFLEYVHPDDREAVNDAYTQSLQQNRNEYEIEHRVVRRTGEIRFVHEKCEHLRDDDGRIIRSIGMVHDITERKRAEEALKQLNAELEQRVAERTAELERTGARLQAERKRFLDVLETLPVMITLIKPDYHVAFANRAYREALGEANGRRCFEYQFDFEEPCRECEAFVPLRTGLPHYWEWTLPSGRTFEIHNFPFVDSDGGPMILEMDIDVTERRQADAALKELNETLERRVAERTAELARSNEDLQQFAYVASHDLQEPLRMISGFLSLLEQRYGPQLDDKARHYISYSVDGAIRMSQLINDLLAYGRITSRDQELSPVELEPALAGALANLHSAIDESHATITHDNLPVVSGSFTQLMQLFQNLIGNAMKFRSPDRPCLIHVGVEQRENEWLLQVRDNGIGIPKESYERIFVIFQRLHARSKYPGTGIGLSVCKKIVERHGGRMWLDSTPDQGSTFYFTLPVISN